MLHGSNGEDGTFEGILDSIGIPYAGCNVLASANGMDKITMKMILQACNVPVVDYVWFTDKQWDSKRQQMIQLVEEVKHTNETVSALDIKVDRMDNRVDDIERAPADNLNTYKRTAITAMISTVAGALATGLIFIIAQVI